MGWWLGLHQPPWSFGFDSQTRGTRENRAPPCVKVPGSSRVPAPPWVGSRSPDGWDQIPRWAGGWVLHQPPWSFGFDFLSHSPSALPPPFTQSPYPPRSLVRDGQTHPHRPRLVVSHSTCPPLSSSPHAHSFVIGPAVIKHTHTIRNSNQTHQIINFSG